ncbi:nucleobindin-2 [Frieseomelitta varia]|uniref:nucleobindin-2 n=1 Tax=Frieseomelitta varia TaxID=561572 RepID=UPI001CB67F04|nr:nucleobindin-2 [Frieseomelitta varia]XP_043517267.1 nucleobindin-2 [Frieseomelitta varia]XP_043517268.1 nucleobindin-2 [Frieseomelitta varia]XP_043517270.1 nucleobindin-2 [Frieseomelitta varia]XP_043517271.1 nucleobindin-2 [Frieseomelitta varia]
MKYFLLFLLITVTVQWSVAPPVNQKSKNHDNENEVEDVEEMVDLEYRRYLMEVVQVLESDPDFQAKLEKATETDIRTGKIADQLEFVNHNVRSKLDEIKREELERLRHLATKENELKNGLDVDHLKITEHLDHTNTRTFEIQDLKKLIAKTTKDLANADRRRREEFKRHEMEKKYAERGKLNLMSDAEKKKYEEEQEALREKRKKHEPIHHPGSKQQLEEVWEKQDHVDTEFNPKTFFFLHDIDGNGAWDQVEVKTLFLKELDKLYAQGTPQDDLLKRAEEMERMREHVFNEADLNKDGLISLKEFLEQTKKPSFQQDEGWQDLDDQQIYTQEEYEAFAKHKQDEIQNLIAKGIIPRETDSIPEDIESFPSQHGQPISPGLVPPQVDPNQNMLHQQFQDQIHPQYQQQPQIVIPQQQIHGQISQQQQQLQGQIPPNQQYQQMKISQNQIPVQQLQAQQAQIQQNQPLVQQQGQIPIQQVQPQAANFQQQQNLLNQVPQNVQTNAVPQQNSLNLPNSQPVQILAQQEINRNKISPNEKV